MRTSTEPVPVDSRYGSHVHDDAWGARAGDTGRHAALGGADVVAVVEVPLDDGEFAAAADSLSASGGQPIAGVDQGVEQ